jgi:hypothetical protein
MRTLRRPAKARRSAINASRVGSPPAPASRPVGPRTTSAAAAWSFAHRPPAALRPSRGRRGRVRPCTAGRSLAPRSSVSSSQSSRGFARASSLAASTRPMQGAVHRRHTHVEHRSGLVGRPTENGAQQQHRPRARCQVLDRGDECQLDGLARDDHGVGLPLAWLGRLQHQIREGLEPRDLPSRWQRDLGICGRRLAGSDAVTVTMTCVRMDATAGRSTWARCRPEARRGRARRRTGTPPSTWTPAGSAR